MTLHMVRKKICVYCPFVICDFVCRHKNYRSTFEFVFFFEGEGQFRIMRIMYLEVFKYMDMTIQSFSTSVVAS